MPQHSGMETTGPQEQLPGILSRIGRVLTSSLDPKVVFERVMKLVGEYFSPRNWSLLLMDEETGRLQFEIVMGVDAAKLKSFSLDAGEGIVGWVCRTGEPVVITDVENEPRFSRRVDELLGFRTRSVVCVPLLNGANHVVGAIELINRVSGGNGGSRDGGDPFTAQDMEILSAIGAFTGIAAENAFLHQKVRELAMVDSLTGVHNRLYFDEALEREAERVKRYGKTLCLLFMDVDGLKTVNDRFGHLTGDKVLCAVADILTRALRKSDILARFGGDEFVILMPFATASDGHYLSSRIEKLIAKWNSAPALPGVKLGLSIGVYSAGAEGLDNLFQMADFKMYENKVLRKKAEELVSGPQMRRYLRGGKAGN